MNSEMKTQKIRAMVKKVFAVAAVSATSLFLYQSPESLSVKTSSAALSDAVLNTVLVSAQTVPEPVAVAPPVIKEAPIREVNIANNGAIFIRGGRVISVSEDAIQVITTWGTADLTWDVQIDFYTKFLKSRSEEEAFEDIQVDDVVDVTGELVKGDVRPAITAHFIRE